MTTERAIISAIEHELKEHMQAEQWDFEKAKKYHTIMNAVETGVNKACVGLNLVNLPPNKEPSKPEPEYYPSFTKEHHIVRAVPQTDSGAHFNTGKPKNTIGNVQKKKYLYIREARIKKGWTLEKLASKTDISYS